MRTLESATNPFLGVVPLPEALPEDPEDFRRRLELSLEAWKHEGLKVVWLEVPIARAGHIPVAVETGFSFHHTGKGYVMLTYRLVAGATVPPYATHYIGAGGVVINSDRELLVVRERYVMRGRGKSYKLPGGAIHEQEHLADGVMREVFEETGITTRFVDVVCFRNMHGYRYGKSDIYFVCRLEPLSREISVQDEEIEECLWMPLELYLGAPDVSVFNKRIVQAALGSAGLIRSEVDGYGDPQKYEFLMPEVRDEP